MKKISLKVLLAASVALTPLAAYAGSDKPVVFEGGYYKVLPSGNTLQTNPSTTGAAPLNIGQGTAPSSPNNGDCWITTGGYYCHYNGSTVGPFGTGTGSGTIGGSGTTGDLAKFTSGSNIGNATAGTDYAPATSGSSILKGNGSGGFSSATSGTDYAPATSGSAILKGNGSGGFSSATSGTDYAPATSGSSLLKGNGSGGFSNATSGTDYAPATSGSSLLYGNGSGGFTNATLRRQIGTTFGDTGGSALTSGSVVYATWGGGACTISAWNITVDAGTATFDIWKIATGTAIPTVTNSIVASAAPAIASGTAIHSTTLTGWTTSVSQNDIFGFKLSAVSTAKYAQIDVECDQ